MAEKQKSLSVITMCGQTMWCFSLSRSVFHDEILLFKHFLLIKQVLQLYYSHRAVAAFECSVPFARIHKSAVAIVVCFLCPFPCVTLSRSVFVLLPLANAIVQKLYVPL